MRRDAKVTDWRIAPLSLLRIPRAAQLDGNLRHIRFVADGNGLWPGVNLGRIGENGPCHTAGDDPLVLDVEVREHRQEDDAGDHKTGGEQLHQRIAKRETTHLYWLASYSTRTGLRRAAGRAPALR